MACHLLGAKPLSEPMLQFCQLDHMEHISMKFYSKFFIQGNALENADCQMTAILSRPQYIISSALAMEILQSCTKPSISSTSTMKKVQICKGFRLQTITEIQKTKHGWFSGSLRSQGVVSSFDAKSDLVRLEISMIKIRLSYLYDMIPYQEQRSLYRNGPCTETAMVLNMQNNQFWSSTRKDFPAKGTVKSLI